MFREGYAEREGKCPEHELTASPGTASLGIETREGLLVGGSRGTGWHMFSTPTGGSPNQQSLQTVWRVAGPRWVRVPRDAQSASPIDTLSHSG